jgi:hypothetical protein
VERRRIRVVAVLLAVVVVGQLLAVTSRQGDDDGGPVAIPAGADRVVSDALLGEGRVLRATVTRETFSPPAHAVYGESRLDDPLDGKMLVVGTAFGDAFFMVPTSETPDFRLVELGSRSVALGHDRAWTWVTWNLPNCTDICQAYAAGRNLSEPEVVDAARNATADRNTPAAGTVPAGLALLGTPRLDLQGFDAPGAQAVSWVREGDPLALTVAPGTELALLTRFWVDGGPVDVRGRRGSSGELARVGLARDLTARAWDEGGRSLLVLTTRMLADEVDEFVTGLRGAGAGEWEELRSRVLEVSSGSLIDRCYTSGESFVPVGRSEGRYRWAMGFQVGRLNQFSHCHVILTPDRSSLGSSGSPRPPPRGLAVATSGIGGATDPVGLFVFGVAPAGTARVRLDASDGRQVEAELAATGPAPGERYYAGFVEGTLRTRPTVVALNGAGAEIARAAGGAPV